MLSAADAAALAGAGVVAGVVGTAGGITSLVSYPALLAVGIAAVPANVANIVALVACWPGSAVASRAELRGRCRWLAGRGALTAAGGAGGAGLLLATPPGAFARLVPFLVVAASAALLAQPRLRIRHERRRHRGLLVPGGLASVSVYNGYFGAGAGVMALTVLLVGVDDHLARANALKNILIGAATAGSAVVLIAAARVDWGPVGPLAAGMFTGSLAGPRVARRLPPQLLRWVVALIGIGLALELWISGG